MNRNEATSHLEVDVFRFTDYPGYTAYLSSDARSVTTWMGHTLGRVISTNGTGIEVRAINGRRYYGRPNGPGMWINLRQYKQQ